MSQPIVEGSVSVPHESVAAWACRCLEKLGMTPADAGQLADSLVQTSLWGIDSHGIARLPHYMERLARGSIKARPAIAVQETGPATAQVHGDLVDDGHVHHQRQGYDHRDDDGDARKGGEVGAAFQPGARKRDAGTVGGEMRIAGSGRRDAAVGKRAALQRMAIEQMLERITINGGAVRSPVLAG